MSLEKNLHKVLIKQDLKQPEPTINTQKARGVFFLEKAVNNLEDLNIVPNKHWLFSAGTEFSENDFSFPVFVRPCPLVPRHGFVDSLVVKNATELNTVSKKTFDVEPEGELLVATPIDCNISGIVCGNSITYGPGNDGATSGKGCGHFYIDQDVISKKIALDSSLIAEGEVPFYEVVFDKNTPDSTILVQARSAPGTNGFKDYIPEQIVVQNIIKAEGDLLEWEDLLKKVDPKTTVVNHFGGSLASHYAIHALLNKITILTTREPVAGETLEKIVIDETYTEQDKNIFIEAFRNGFNSTRYILDSEQSYQELKEYCILALATLHNYSTIKFNKDYLLLGNVLGIFCKTAFAVSIGESRYCSELKNIVTLPGNRAHCYGEIKTLSNQAFLDKLTYAYFSFKKLHYSGGYGGPAWFTCTDKIVDIYNLCLNGEVNHAVKEFNEVIHLNHNGGFYLNKIIDKSYFDEAAKNPSEFTIKNLHKILMILKKVHDFIKLKKEYDEIKILNKKEILNCSTLPKLKSLITGIEEKETVKVEKTVEFNPKPSTQNAYSFNDFSKSINSTVSVAKEVLINSSTISVKAKNKYLLLKPNSNAWKKEYVYAIKQSSIGNGIELEGDYIFHNIPYYWELVDNNQQEVFKVSKEKLNKLTTDSCFKLESDFQEKSISIPSIPKEINNLSDKDLKDLFSLVDNLFVQWQTKQGVGNKNASI